MNKLLVTGGAGFIGSEFVRQGVEKGYKIIVVDKLTYAGDMERLKHVHKHVTFYKADITDKEYMAGLFMSEKPFAVIHMAAESHVDRSLIDASMFIDTNVKGTQIVLDISRQYGIERFLNISTDEVYGELKEIGRFCETDPLSPNSPYSVTKASADMLGRAYFRTHGVPVITVRPSNNFGAWQYPEKLVPVVIARALKNEKIPVYGTGQNVREWLFVADCVDGIFRVLENGKVGEIYNIGSGDEKKNIELVKAILGELGKSEELIEFTADRPGHDFRYSLNSDKIKEHLGWGKRTSFAEGIKETVRWYVDNKTTWLYRLI